MGEAGRDQRRVVIGARGPYRPRMSSDPRADLTLPEMRRYGRHLVLSELGLAGQQRMKAGSVLLVGAGGLGSPAALYLAAAGVGTIGVADFDVVDESNLQRQVAHGTAAVGRSKLDSLRARLHDLNPHVQMMAHPVRLDRSNALAILADYDVVLDGADNFATRFLVNDACVRLGKPDVHGSILRFEGQASVFDARSGPCYRCLFRDPPPAGAVPSCAEAGVLGVLPGVIGSIMATEAIKLIAGIGEPLVGRLLLYDALAMRFRELRVRKDADCPACGPRGAHAELPDYDAICGVGESAVRADTEVSAEALAERLARGERLVLVDVRERFEWEIGHLPGAVLLPLGELPQRVGELDPRTPIVLYCHHGVRSRRALDWLASQGFSTIQHLAGGTEAWSTRVDASLPRY